MLSKDLENTVVYQCSQQVKLNTIWPSEPKAFPLFLKFMLMLHAGRMLPLSKVFTATVFVKQTIVILTQ